MNLSENLKRIRKEHNLSQEQLAEKLNVSRQSVSKWESGAAYPEMDKVLQLCKMFNLNIDELLNQDIKEVNNKKQSKINVNKYIDDFLSYVTKTIDMFSNMKFGQILKCIIEQIILILIITIILNIIGDVFSSFFSTILDFKYGYKIVNLINSLYSVLSFIITAVLILYIFKVRYLDYYEMAEKEETEETEEEKEVEEVKEDNKVKNENKKEKVIIRDPNHSGDRFVSGVFKFILFFIKIFVIFIGLPFCFSLISFVVLLVVSFLFVKTGLLFVGGFLGLIACITLNLLVLDLLFSFIINKSIKKGLFAIAFFSSLILGGIAIGLITISIKDFKIEEYNPKYLTKTKEVITIDDKQFIESYNANVEYVETDSKDIVIESEYASFCTVNTFLSDNIYHISTNCSMNSSNKLNSFIKMINDKVISIPDYVNVKVYASKENIKKIQNNKDKYYKELENNERAKLNKEIDELNKRIHELEDSKCN